MKNRWKSLTIAAIAGLSLVGCQLTPKTSMTETPNIQLAHTSVPSNPDSDVPPSLGQPNVEIQTAPIVASATPQPAKEVHYPKTPLQLLAEEKGKATPAPAKDGKRKKARNSDVTDFKRDYSELIKKPDVLGFHPRDDHYQRVIETVRTSFVENIPDDQIATSIKKELKVFLDQAKVKWDPKALDGVPLSDLYSKVQEIAGPKVNKDLLGYVTITGALDGLKDAYSVLMTPSETSKLKEQLQSKGFGGIGVYIELDRENHNQLTVFEPIEGSPAAAAGLEAGDVIIEIDGKTTKGITIDQAQSRIRGEVGSKVQLKIERRKQQMNVAVERGLIHVVSVTSKFYPGDVAYVRLRAFGADTAEELHNALMKAKEHNAKGVILDLRNNGGGYIESAVNVVGEFAPSNTLVVYTIDRDKNKRLYNSRKDGGLGIPIVCMINEFSASASEITAGALRDHKIATLVGDHSFGKGSVQQLYPLESVFSTKGADAPQLKLTIAKFYAPGGDVIDKKGIEPQVVVDMEPRFVGKPAQDIQLQKALELLGGKVSN